MRVFTYGDDPEVREAKDLANKMKEDYGVHVEFLDIEERNGKEVAEVYDVYTTPSFLLTTDEGVVLNSWIGKIPAEFELKSVVSL